MNSNDLRSTVTKGFEELVNKGNYAAADEYISPRYVNHTFPAPAPGPEGFKTVIKMFRTSFPDIRVIIEDTLAEGDKVATRGHFVGTHGGEFMGIPPTGKKVRVNYLDMWRAENGKFVENWVQMDLLSLMQQLGVVPSPSK